MTLEQDFETERGFSALMIGTLGKKFYNPNLFLDNRGIIRALYPSARPLAYDANELIGHSYKEFLSEDLYDDRLRAIASRLATALDHPLPRHPEQFQREVETAQKDFSITGTVHRIDALIRQYEREQSTEPKMIKSEIRIRLGNDVRVTVPDVLWLKKYQGPRGWDYAGAVVELKVGESDLSKLHRLKRRAKQVFSEIEPYQGLPTYGIEHEVTLSLDDFNEQVEMRYYVTKIIDGSIPTPLVLDFSTVTELTEEATNRCRLLISATKHIAQSGELVIGNARKPVREFLTKRFEAIIKEGNATVKPVPLRFYTLDYPDVKAPTATGPEPFTILEGKELETHVNQSINELRDRLSAKGLLPVQTDSEGKSLDIRLTGESAQQ